MTRTTSGHRWAALLSTLEKALTPEVLKRFHEQVPELEVEGKRYKSADLESQVSGMDKKAFRDFRAKNPGSPLTAYAMKRANFGRSETLRRSTHVVETTFPLSDAAIADKAKDWVGYADEHDHPARLVLKPRTGTRRITAVRNYAVIDAGHSPFLTENHLNTLRTGVESLHLQGKLTPHEHNEARVLDATHRLRFSKNPDAGISYGALPTRMLPLLGRAAEAAGAEGAAMKPIFDVAAAAHAKHPMPTHILNRLRIDGTEQRARTKFPLDYPALLTANAGKVVPQEPTVRLTAHQKAQQEKRGGEDDQQAQFAQWHAAIKNETMTHSDVPTEHMTAFTRYTRSLRKSHGFGPLLQQLRDLTWAA